MDFNNMTVGQLAKQANVSIRTLQYYHKINLLKPSSFSEGGRRLYNSNDMAILHQVITLKYLGFSLEDIKQRIMPVDSPRHVVTLLTNQTTIIKEQISKSEKLLESIEMLKKEINNTNNVDWSKYSNMLKLIGENNEYYWVLKHLDKDILDSIIERHETYGDEDINVGWWKNCFEKCIELEKRGIIPESIEAQELASEWWQVVMKYSKGDSKLIGKLVKFYKSADQWPEEFREIQKQAEDFMEKAIEVYLINNNLSLEMEF